MSKEIDFPSWLAQDLKQYLKIRGVSCSTLKKCDLARLCSLATELKLDIIETDDYHDMYKHRRTVTINGDSRTLTEVSKINDGWTNNLTILPNIEQCDVLIYLINKCEWSDNRLRNYKSDNGYKLYHENHIDDVMAVVVPSSDGEYFYLRSTCVPETRQKSLPYITWILASKRGEVHSGGCTCVADDGTCKHCVALLFALSNFNNRHKDRHTVVGTDVLCKWDRPRKESEPMEVDRINLRPIPESDVNHTPRPAKPTLDAFTPAVETLCLSSQSIEKRIYNLCKDDKSVMLHVLQKPNDSDSEEEVLDPMSLSELALSVKSGNPEVSSAETLLNEMENSYDKDACKKIEEITQGQADNDDWFRYRKGLITASSFGSLLHFKFGDNVSDKNYLLKKVMGDVPTLNTPSIVFGRTHEKVARNLYSAQYRQTHKKATINQCGLFVDHEHPFLGASPDGIVKCKCCGNGLIEIKCSYMHQEKNAHEVCEDNHYHLYLDENNTVRLKPESAWYAQIQGQLGVCKLNWCDFVFYTKRGITVDRISADSDFFDEVLKKSKLFFSKYVFKALNALDSK